MTQFLATFALSQRILVVVTACFLAGAGMYAFRELPIDAFPDMTNIQVKVLTEARGLSPIEVERFVTYPIELEMTGLRDLQEIRSLSKPGLSQISIIFEDHVDIYFARQLVLERLMRVGKRLPPGADPVMAPVTTGLGEVYQYYIDSPVGLDGQAPSVGRQALMDQRTLQDWVIRLQLKSVPGVIDVNSFGGFVRQYQVLVNPALLRKYDLPLKDVFDAVARNNSNAGGNILNREAEKYIVRGVGLIKRLEDIQRIVVKEVGGTPVYIGDVAEVRIGHAVRRGAAILNGEKEVVAGIVLMLRGENAQQVVDDVKRKVSEIHRHGLLPHGWRIVPFYDRSELVEAALETVQSALIEGVVLVMAVLFVYLGNIRSALVVVATLVLTPLVTFVVMGQVGISANLMSLGGMAIAIGMIVDGSLVVVENVYRHLAEPRDRRIGQYEIVLQAVREVGRPVAFGISIIIIVFLPVATLQGMEGKLFKPLAYTIMIALLVSLLVSLTLSPVLCFQWLRPGREGDTTVIRWAKRIYLPVLRWGVAHRRLVVGTALALLGTSLALYPFLGGEFLPILNEGSLTPQIIRHPSVSLGKSIELEKQVHKTLLEFPEVRTIVGKIGRPDIATEPQGPNESDPVATLSPMTAWTTADDKEGLLTAIRERVAGIPGVSVLMSQPIQERLEELISGVRTEVAIKLYGNDLSILKEKADQIETIMATVQGVKDIRVEDVFGQTYLTIDIDRENIARHGLNVADVRDIIETAIAGKEATRIWEGERSFPLMVRFPKPRRDSVEAIANILIEDPSGAVIPLSGLATIELREGPVRISRENVKRRIYIGFNLAGRDVESAVQEGRRKIAAQVSLPPGYRIEWAGAFENMERAMARLRLIVPITIALIFLLLFTSFNSIRYAALIILNLPFASIGGIVALWLTGQYLSVPASVGFINLFGIAVLNGIVLVSYINKLRQDGLPTGEAVQQGSLLRLRPVLMTASVAVLGLAPMALAEGVGAEVQRPLATVVIGGLITSTALTLIVLPALYQWFQEPDAEQRS